MTDTELVTRYYDLFNRGDWDGMCALLAEDVAHDLNQGERQVGRPAFRAFLDRMARSYRALGLTSADAQLLKFVWVLVCQISAPVVAL